MPPSAREYYGVFRQLDEFLLGQRSSFPVLGFDAIGMGQLVEWVLFCPFWFTLVQDGTLSSALYMMIAYVIYDDCLRHI